MAINFIGYDITWSFCWDSGTWFSLLNKSTCYGSWSFDYSAHLTSFFSDDDKSMNIIVTNIANSAPCHLVLRYKMPGFTWLACLMGKWNRQETTARCWRERELGLKTWMLFFFFFFFFKPHKLMRFSPLSHRAPKLCIYILIISASYDNESSHCALLQKSGWWEVEFN